MRKSAGSRSQPMARLLVRLCSQGPFIKDVRIKGEGGGYLKSRKIWTRGRGVSCQFGHPFLGCYFHLRIVINHAKMALGILQHTKICVSSQTRWLTIVLLSFVSFISGRTATLQMRSASMLFSRGEGLTRKGRPQK